MSIMPSPSYLCAALGLRNQPSPSIHAGEGRGNEPKTAEMNDFHGSNSFVDEPEVASGAWTEVVSKKKSKMLKKKVITAEKAAKAPVATATGGNESQKSVFLKFTPKCDDESQYGAEEKSIVDDDDYDPDDDVKDMTVGPSERTCEFVQLVQEYIKEVKSVHKKYFPYRTVRKTISDYAKIIWADVPVETAVVNCVMKTYAESFKKAQHASKKVAFKDKQRGVETLKGTKPGKVHNKTRREHKSNNTKTVARNNQDTKIRCEFGARFTVKPIRPEQKVKQARWDKSSKKMDYKYPESEAQLIREK
jgi:hypothetical protein